MSSHWSRATFVSVAVDAARYRHAPITGAKSLGSRRIPPTKSLPCSSIGIATQIFVSSLLSRYFARDGALGGEGVLRRGAPV